LKLSIHHVVEWVGCLGTKKNIKNNQSKFGTNRGHGMYQVHLILSLLDIHATPKQVALSNFHFATRLR